jgi:hypothetical protein
MNVVVDLPNEKLAKQFLAAKPADLDVNITTNGSTVKVDNKDLPQTPKEANALYKKAGKVLGTPKKKAKKIGVVGISKAENVQLGLILRWVALELDWDTIPNEVLVDPEALTKLIGRYQNKAK